ncbi:pyrimidine 5'-nucleotidase [Chitinimonas arctica]|uniref:Pyrimidine 5'-nucleotidase n=1 Tax=Chitinimonas arctica TaxID=2594795 RepID=A0A516SEI3_9NEIS|nr:pyrimidine 5'-nucleotidase [Chitinimonas arctica]QDQ26428.1 pyrimidine 5'-nucleotidase [Chitinimonas arctica]
MVTWIFDLDNTLHDAEPFIFPEMNRLMTRYMATHLDMSEEQADSLRLHYWQRYGTTLAGLLRHDGVDAAHFLSETHHFPHLLRQLLPMRGMQAMLRRLPGRKILFTNGPQAYALAVLRGLGIAHLFDGVIAVEHTRLRPKPEAIGYRQLLKRYRLDPSRCIMVEDTHANLVTARKLGIRTVWLGRRARHGFMVDLALPALAHLPRHAKRRGWLISNNQK